MKASYQHFGQGPEQGLYRAFWVRSPKFGFHWHYHSEYEITCVKHGNGTRMVGDNVSTFEDGDVVFLGSNLPHTWISDDDFNLSEDIMEVAVLQFHPSNFPDDILRAVELRNVEYLLNNSQRGFEITGDTQSRVSEMIYRMIDAEGFTRFSLLFELLNQIGASEEKNRLASNAYHAPLNNSSEVRIQRVCQYIHEQFMNPIKLETIAEIANMNATSFCRFFKKSTGHSFFEYMNDLRIGKACNLLLDSRNYSISEIAFRSGFKSQTLFNRIFLRKKNMTPSNFRKLRNA